MMMACVFFVLGYLLISAQAQFPWHSCPDTSGMVTACVVTRENCWSDYNCPRGLRCCPSGCGRTCQRPVRCRWSPFGSKRFCLHDRMCIRGRDEYCCNFFCQEPYATIG